MKIIAGERVRQARELKGWTQAVLAKQVGVTQAAIAQVEAGAFMASDELVSAIASKTNQPLRFFYQDPPPEFPVGSLLFRAHASMTKKELAATYRHAQEAFELWAKLRRGMPPIPVKIPQLSLDPSAAAQETRRMFSVPAGEPIPHLVNLLEWNGLVALVVPDLQSRDAFSLWLDDLPIMALSSGRPGDRGRMNAAHELGHLVLHPGKSRFEVDDSDADDFAAEFLMPEVAMRREIKTPVTIASLASLKQRWRVSIQALIVRSKELGVVTDRQYRYLFEQMSAMGWRKAEPVPIVVEQPRALRQLAEMRFGNPIDYAALAHEVAMEIDHVREMLTHYAAKDDGRRPAPHKLVSLQRKRS